jgi:hypothetical protein
MPLEKYRSISMQRELVDKVEDYVKSHPETGYKSLADFITDAVRKRFEELKTLTPAPEPPTLEHFNLDEYGVRILDRSLTNQTSKGKIIDVYFRPEGVLCDWCRTNSCRHVQFALSLPGVQKILIQKGWEIKRRIP